MNSPIAHQIIGLLLTILITWLVWLYHNSPLVLTNVYGDKIKFPRDGNIQVQHGGSGRIEDGFNYSASLRKFGKDEQPATNTIQEVYLNPNEGVIWKTGSGIGANYTRFGTTRKEYEYLKDYFRIGKG